jgi:phosphoglucosamine mutase
LHALIVSEKTLHELKQVMKKYPQTLVNVRIKDKIDLTKNLEIQDAVRQAESQMGSRGRVLLRASGTEPLIRVMVEADSEDETKQLADMIAMVVEKAAA